ncbi:MAG: excinuclease ABC subunit UvrA [Flavobacteriales bacterium]|nr:excinuclease ABC subunit UvrA [Flavobacteriales bacterium]MBL6872792.1 excinuclease ABC subunit UvrA [Flavobacteriales bacterium]
MSKSKETLQIFGAKEHNLKNIDITIPRNELVVITGLSGSGKSSLAFDTIYAEGQRRYIETFTAYARQFLGGLERPDVDKISGLSPVISIEQKTTNKNPRSTVGTITEIYDFLRLLFARASDAYSYNTGEKMVSYTNDEINDIITNELSQEKTIILAPVVISRKGHYRELFEQTARQGFLKVRVDGELTEITPGMKLDRFKTHDIEIVIDKLIIKKENEKRLKQSIETAMKYGDGLIMTLNIESGNERYFSRHLMCSKTGISYAQPEPNSFSFNSPKGACSKCNGLGVKSVIDKSKIINENLSINNGGLTPIAKNANTWITGQIETIGRKYNFTLSTPIKDIPKKGMDAILYGSNETFDVELKEAGLSKSYKINFEGIINFIEDQFKNSSSTKLRRWASEFMIKKECKKCNGSRLKTESLFFKIDEKNISEVAEMDIIELKKWIDSLESKLNEKQKIIGNEIIKELSKRIQFLIDVGLNYLSLNRSSRSISGGESQRIRLATQIGSQLTDVLYILDEPSIGLHQRDNHKLIQSLKKLRDIGNSIIVVEHDKDMILSADHIIDIGPGAGIHGGEIIAQGNIKEFLSKGSLTIDYLTGVQSIQPNSKRRSGNGKKLSIKGARGNNLKNINVDFPLAKFIGVIGVSGSGKSTLVNETLYPILNQYFYNSVKKPLEYDSISGLEHIDKVIEVDQSPIGRTPRSNPATYSGVFSEIRALYTNHPESKARGYKVGRFSFNVSGGRCEDCKGAGVKTIEMNFLPDVYVNCESCNGKRYNKETLEIRYKGKSISDVLEMTLNQALEFFDNHPKIKRQISALVDVGLGYVKLGQQSTTLSGGESQRVKLASELAKKSTGNTFYILDEPTTGLHFEDVNVLLQVIEKIVNKGNTVVVIEHNLDVIKMTDHIIEIGPDGGKNGGNVINTGTPEELIQSTKGHTAPFLKDELIN